MSTIIFLISSFFKKKGKVSIFVASLPLSLLPKISYQQDGIKKYNHSNKTINFTFFSKKGGVQ